MGQCSFCKYSACTHNRQVVSPVTVKGGIMEMVPRATSPLLITPVDGNMLVNDLGYARGEIERLTAQIERERLIAHQGLCDASAGQSNAERALVNLQNNVAVQIADAVARREAELTNELISERNKVHAQYNYWANECRRVDEHSVNVSNDCLRFRRETEKLKQEIEKRDEKIAVLKGERPSIFTRTVAPMKNLGKKLGQPFVAVAEMVSNFLVGLKVSTVFVLGSVWGMVRICFMSLVALPIFERQVWTAEVAPLSKLGLIDWLYTLTYLVIRIGIVVTAIACVAGNPVPATWLPGILTYLGAHLAPYVCGHLSSVQNFKLEWVATHFTSIVHGIYWTLLGTNLVSLVAEIGRAKNKKKVV